jgi:Uma2 family endonuclease
VVAQDPAHRREVSRVTGRATLVRVTADPAAQLEPGATLSIAEWVELAEDVGGELVDGVLVEDEMTDWVHDAVVIYLATLLRTWARPRGGLVGGSEVKFQVSARRGRKADLSVYLPGAPRPPGRGVIATPPSIAIEVVSPRPRDARRDRVEKLEEYAAFGVRFYWVVDPQSRTLEIYERVEDGRYARAVSAAEGVVSTIPGCDGLTIDLDALWAEVDELESMS